MNETVMENVLVQGERKIHIMRMGQAVAVEPWIRKVEETEGATAVRKVAWHEADVDVHHLLVLWWKNPPNPPSTKGDKAANPPS